MIHHDIGTIRQHRMELKENLPDVLKLVNVVFEAREESIACEHLNENAPYSPVCGCVVDIMYVGRFITIEKRN